MKHSLIKYLLSWIHIQAISYSFSIIFITLIINNDMTYKISVQRNFFVYNAHVLINYTFKTSNANKQHQSSIVILMMIQHIPCKRTLVCHVAVESNPYLSYTSVLLHCINTVMTRVVFRPFRLMNSFDRNCFLHVLFVIEIIWLPLSAFLWCIQIHVQNGSKQWAQ